LSKSTKNMLLYISLNWLQGLNLINYPGPALPKVQKMTDTKHRFNINRLVV